MSLFHFNTTPQPELEAMAKVVAGDPHYVIVRGTKGEVQWIATSASAPKQEGREPLKLDMDILYELPQSVTDAAIHLSMWMQQNGHRDWALYDCQKRVFPIDAPKAEGATAGRVMTEAEDRLIRLEIAWQKLDEPDNEREDILLAEIKDAVREVIAERAVLPLEEGQQRGIDQSLKPDGPSSETSARTPISKMANNQLARELLDCVRTIIAWSSPPQIVSSPLVECASVVSDRLRI